MEERTTFFNLLVNNLHKLSELFAKQENKTNEDLLSDYISDMSEEQKQAVKETCDFVDTFYQKRRELDASGKRPSEWMNDEVENATKEILPDATAEEINEFKKAVALGMEERAIMQAKSLDKEMYSAEEGGAE